MNTSALKAFAPTVRKQLMEAVSRKLDLVLTARTPDYLDTYAGQVRALRELATIDRKGLIERVAYTWFNRLAALRYLDARNWHPFHVKVLMAASSAATLPELFTVARLGAVPEELRRYVDVGRIEALLQGRIPSGDPQGEVYRLLVLASCRFYNEILPDVFERLDDETELLLPDDLLTEQSVTQGFRIEITDRDCDQVEVLGWLYQFYISEKKDQVMARKGIVPPEDVPARTQLFTPHYVVRYLVENTLGKLWLSSRPDSVLRTWMTYYVDPVELEAEPLRFQRPQDIRVCDPAVGSGHMLTYAFDLLYVIYEEEGYPPSDIPALILKHNLTGIEIDARAAQLAALALTLKAREKSPRFFEQRHFVRPNIVELRDVRFTEAELTGYSDALRLGGLFTPPMLRLMHQFVDAKSLGSLIEPCVGEADIAFARGSVEARDLGTDLFLNETHKKVLRVLEQAQALTQRYHSLMANPPYMGSSVMTGKLKSLAGNSYKDSKGDLFAMFIERGLSLVTMNGFAGLVTMQSWMFLSGYQRLRARLIKEATLKSMVHLGTRGFDSIGGEVVQTTAFILKRHPSNAESGVYFRVTEGRSELEKETALLKAISMPDSPIKFLASADRFTKIPGQPIAYWASAAICECFANLPAFEAIGETLQGMTTCDNDFYLRFWWEVQESTIDRRQQSREQAKTSACKWFPYTKGGSFRRWYGNDEFVVNWEKDGALLQSRKNPTGEKVWAHNFNLNHIFREGASYSSLSSGLFGCRFTNQGGLFDQKGSMIFVNRESDLLPVIGLFNSNVVSAMLQILTPTLDFNPGALVKIPVQPDALNRTEMHGRTEEAVRIAREDWNTFETAPAFEFSPLLGRSERKTLISASWTNWQTLSSLRIQRMQELEAGNNALFIELYGLQDELTANVPEDQITLARADVRTDMAAFLSYAVGCMMGRYSLDHPGLILADVGKNLRDYAEKVGREGSEITYMPDAHGIVPILDEEWFADDVVARTREFLRATFGESTLRDNIRFIEEALGRDLRTYFLSDFYKDHLQTYRKRPIYWMVQSPRKSFNVLIYLHRYTRDTMNVVLNRYLREFQVKLRSKIEHLQQVGTSASASNREKTIAVKDLAKFTKTLHECEEWERQTILPMAQVRIELDLDDGVKVNYLKLGEALASIPGLAAAEE